MEPAPLKRRGRVGGAGLSLREYNMPQPTAAFPSQLGGVFSQYPKIELVVRITGCLISDRNFSHILCLATPPPSFIYQYKVSFSHCINNTRAVTHIHETMERLFVYNALAFELHSLKTRKKSSFKGKPRQTAQHLQQQSLPQTPNA